MSTLTFLKYNNYYNRTLKGLKSSESQSQTAQSYKNSSMGYAEYDGLNFDIKDGIATIHCINDSLRTEFPFDYMVVSNVPNGEVSSRWFVMEARWNRKYQWIVSLKRDVLCDYWFQYKDRAFYARKGMPVDASGDSPLVYNSEDRSFNQILKTRTALKQESTQSGRYIIGFIDKTWEGAKVYKGTAIDISDEDWNLLNSGNVGYITDAVGVRLALVSKATGPTEGSPYTDGTDCHIWVSTNDSTKYGGAQHGAGTVASGIGGTALTVDEGGGRETYEKLAESMAGNLTEYSAYCMERALTVAPSNSNIYNKYRNKIVNHNGRVYSITFSTLNYEWSSAAAISNSIALEIYNKFKANQYGASLWNPTSSIGDYISVVVRSAKIQPIIAEVGVDMTVANNPRPATTNPYNIFVIEDDANGVARDFAGYFASQYGATFLYDLQLFPYKPETTETGRININPDGTAIYLRWATSDSRSGCLSHNEIAAYSTALDKKKGAVVDMCRLISPNGSSAWEFNPSLIGGVPANSIRYEFTLMPFASYLHIFPKFNNQYGYGTVNKINDSGVVSTPDLGETRGMVCTGPWSLPYATNNWSTYQLQNSAYMDSFNRQIENMHIQHKAEMWQEGHSTSPLWNRVRAGLKRSMSGGPLGSFLNAGLDVIANPADEAMNDYLRQEEINYTRDQFYNDLRNIQAQSQPLKSSSTTVIGNSYYPIIEYYSSSDAEKTILENDLRYHGWTMGAKTTVQTIYSNMMSFTNWMTNAPTRYIQGDILEIGEEFTVSGIKGIASEEDAHVANEIASELNKGIYMRIA